MVSLIVIILRIISVFSLIYGIIILDFSGIKTSFLFFWFFLFAMSLIGSFFLSYLHKGSHTQIRLSYFLTGFIIFSFLLVSLTEFFIIRESMKAPQEHADYLIILGAQVRKTTPSKTLNNRIEAASKYLKENPETIAICSGGMGPGEEITEAQAIKDGLIARGISANRIILEDRSTSTVENLKNSKELISPSSLVVLVTSNFHILRAKKIAEHMGYETISTCPANEFFVTTISYYVREFFALVKDAVVGNLSLF